MADGKMLLALFQLGILETYERLRGKSLRRNELDALRLEGAKNRVMIRYVDPFKYKRRKLRNETKKAKRALSVSSPETPLALR